MIKVPPLNPAVLLLKAVSVIVVVLLSNTTSPPHSTALFPMYLLLVIEIEASLMLAAPPLSLSSLMQSYSYSQLWIVLVDQVSQ